MATAGAQDASSGLRNEQSWLMDDFYENSLAFFDTQDLLMVITCMLTSKKLFFVAENPYDAHKAMFTIRDAIIRSTGFEWPHLFATCFALAEDSDSPEFDVINNNDLLNITLPQILSTRQYILMNQILPELFEESQLMNS